VRYSQFFFVLILLISLLPAVCNAQVPANDSLKKVTVDTIIPDEDEGLDQKVTYSAEDSAYALPRQGKAFLYGNAKVKYGEMDMQAEFIEIDYANNTISAYGNKDSLGAPVGTPIFRDRNEPPIEAEKIIYNLKTKKGKIYNALTKQGELLVFGNQIKKDSNNIVYFSQMKCIPCQEADARTVFRATKAKVIPNDKIVTGPMFLEIGGVPTPLGLPFGYFPNTKKQHNGILLPTFGVSPNQGFNLQEGGFYWGISEQTDMVIRGSIYANGSYALNATNSYNLLYRANGFTYVGFKQFNIGDRDIPDQYVNQRSYEVRWSHFQDNKRDPSVRFTADVNFVNNQKFNRLNAINTDQYLTNTFQSKIDYTKTFKRSSISLTGVHRQNTITEDVEIQLPILTYNVNRFFPFKREKAIKQNVFDKIGISYMLDARNVLTGKDSTIFRTGIPDGLKYGVRHSLPISTNFNILKYITATPAIDLSSVMLTSRTRKDFISNSDTNYVLSRQEKDFTATLDAIFRTAFNTKVYFDYVFRRGSVKQIRHLMIPTLTYSYRPDYGDPRYGYYRRVQRDTLGNFSSYSILENSLYQAPSIGEQNALTLNLSNNIEAKLKQKTDTGVTFRKAVVLQNLGISGSYNFAADSFNLSTIGFDARSVLFKYFDVTAFASYDPYVYSKTHSVTVNRFLYQDDGRLLRFVSSRFSVRTSVGSNMIEAMKKTRQDHSLTNGAERGAKETETSGDLVPWNLNLSYVLDLNKPNDRKIHPTQTINFGGDLMPTKFWKIGITSGFDFRTQQLTYTTFNIYRDLKCWEARIDWVPFGPRKQYMVAISLKSSMFRDIRIPRQRQWYDNFQ
jgi:hypothetical protein